MTMKTIIVASVTLVLCGPLAASAQPTSSTDRQIAEAVQILPEDLRAGPSELDDDTFDWGDRSRPHPHYWTV